MRLVLLGTAAAIGGARRDNTSLVLDSGESLILIDCPGSVTAKLDRVGIDFRRVSKVFLTHDHIDHIYGLPSLIHCLRGREGKIKVFGPPPTLSTVESLLRDLRIFSGRNYPQVDLIPVNHGSDRPFFHQEWVSCYSARAQHSRETCAYRFESKAGGWVYCSDSGSSPEVLSLSRGAKWLFHDTNAPHRFKTEFGDNHSSAREAAQTAEAAGVDTLVFIHIDWPREFEENELIQEAEKYFPGRVVLPQDGQEFSFGGQPEK
jgi:ribonuclease Z